MKEPVGRVYVLTNPRMTGLVKIGFTLGTVEGRARELDATGTPEPFEIAYQIEVRGPDSLERRVHEKLIHKRVRNSREFFEVDVIEAIFAIRQLVVDPLDEDVHPRYLELVDETAKRRAAERLAQERAQIQYEQDLKEFRYSEFVKKSEQFHSHKSHLLNELNSLKLQFETYPDAVKLTWIDTVGVEVSKTLFWTLAFAGAILFFVDFVWSVTAWVTCFAVFVIYAKIKADVLKKDRHNSAILKIAKEIQGLEFDLQKFEKQKPKLDKDLAQYVSSNPVRTNEQGFEPSARVSGRMN